MYTIEQVAKMLRVKPVTVRWWRAKLELGTRFGMNIALSDDDVAKLRTRNLRVGRPPTRDPKTREKRKERDSRRNSS